MSLILYRLTVNPLVIERVSAAAPFGKPLTPLYCIPTNKARARKEAVEKTLQNSPEEKNHETVC